MTAAAPSLTSERARAFVEQRRPRALRLGRDLVDVIADPDAFAARLTDGLRELADPEYEAGSRRVAPGIGALLGVRWPLMAAVQRGFRQALGRERVGAPLLAVTDRLYRERELEQRWFAFGLLERLVLVDAERSWQLLRRGARDAGDWITVDTLAHPFGRGILAEPYRWAELEQLVYAPSRWERRLVGSTIATIPFVDHRRGREPAIADRALPILADLIGDAEPDVQKALSWALRSLTLVDRVAVGAFAERAASTARSSADGHRAWVIRDALGKLDPALAADLRARLTGIRRRPGAPSTSHAAETATRFGDLPLGRAFAEPPLTEPPLI